MDSLPIAQFLELTYSTPPVSLTSVLGHEIGTNARGVVGKAIYSSVISREVRILSLRSQEYFRRTQEASLGHLLEYLLGVGREERVWGEVRDVVGAGVADTDAQGGQAVCAWCPAKLYCALHCLILSVC
ncbi:hypothetical protein PENVUL_c001G09942 [Penicillium vulpinum]|uniref:Glutathione S-transferase UstS-like C-terminal domain-containing protein n=2 Tax=Penicillium vulpinum TaxID=29845 RepID=A0A1V6SEK8_9EURO|nr:hypothetical protein PENVUL_c001G09942 [Penicillium vulpinum]